MAEQSPFVILKREGGGWGWILEDDGIIVGESIEPYVDASAATNAAHRVVEVVVAFVQRRDEGGLVFRYGDIPE